jgi:hypothetical protein
MKAWRRWWMFAMAACGAAQAAEPVLPEPPPYGAYYWNIAATVGDRSYGLPVAERIARHYGYGSLAEALQACLATGRAGQCSDPVAHRRDEAAEIRQFGFRSWDDAVMACVRNWRNDIGPPNGKLRLRGRPLRVSHCFADPFLGLRLAQRRP